MRLPCGSFVNVAGSLLKTGVSRLTALTLLLALTFLAGYTFGDKDPPPISFHDMIVNHADGFSVLVTPNDSRVKALARQLETPQNAYLYVRDAISFDPALPVEPAGVIADQKRASCIGKAVLLSSIYRAMGMDSTAVRVVTGEVEAGQGIIDHAWVEIEENGECLQQDSTDLLGIFSYNQFKGMAYTDAFIRRENYTFNDKGFAVISRLNMMKGIGHPIVTKGIQ